MRKVLGTDEVSGPPEITGREPIGAAEFFQHALFGGFGMVTVAYSSLDGVVDRSPQLGLDVGSLLLGDGAQCRANVSIRQVGSHVSSLSNSSSVRVMSSHDLINSRATTRPCSLVA